VQPVKKKVCLTDSTNLQSLNMEQNKKITWFEGIVNPEIEEANPLLSWIWCGFLFLLGMFLWGYFLNFGKIPFDFHDWAEVNAPRIAFLKDAVTKGVLPLHMQDASALRGVTDRYMALPDVLLSPQILLLKWLDVGDFILIHTWLLYAIGFWGLYRLKKSMHLSLFGFTWFFLLFYFNGHITSHYAVGHITWGGYFLFPWFVYLVIRMINGDHSWKWVAKISFLLFFMFLQGSFHQFIWCLLFLAFLALTGRKNLFTVLKAGMFSCLLSMVRIIPPALQASAFDDDFLGGFTSPIQLIRSFIQIIPPSESLNSAVTGGNLGWWEFDHYIGVSGALFLLIFGILWLKNRRKETGYPAILVPMIVLTFFSIGKFYGIFRLLPIPLFSGERVSARFLILPLVFLMAEAVYAMQQSMEIRKFDVLSVSIPLLILLFGLPEFWSHLETWKVLNAFQAFPYTYTDLTIKTVANHHDPSYTNGLLIGMAITILTVILLAGLVWRENRHTKNILVP